MFEYLLFEFALSLPVLIPILFEIFTNSEIVIWLKKTLDTASLKYVVKMNFRNFIQYVLYTRAIPSATEKLDENIRKFEHGDLETYVQYILY
jgi:hypothetical protein